MIFNLYLFDRKGACLYFHEWQRLGKPTRPTVDEVRAHRLTQVTHKTRLFLGASFYRSHNDAYDTCPHTCTHTRTHTHMHTRTHARSCSLNDKGREESCSLFLPLSRISPSRETVKEGDRDDMFMCMCVCLCVCVCVCHMKESELGKELFALLQSSHTHMKLFVNSSLTALHSLTQSLPVVAFTHAHSHARTRTHATFPLMILIHTYSLPHTHTHYAHTHTKHTHTH